MLQIMDAMQPAGEQDRAGWQEMPVLYEKRNHGGWLTLSRPNRISCRSYSTNDTALHDAATKPALHRRDARRLVVLVGQRKAMAIAVKGAQTRRRWSKLGEWLAMQCQVNT